MPDFITLSNCNQKSIALLFSLFLICSCDTPSPFAETTADTEVVITDMSIPGPRTCFWARGPFSKDPYINLAYPDAGVFYWAAFFTIPDGAQLFMEGEFPHSRYMSMISYDGRGAPVESLADYLIQPEEGAVNPFIAGAKRNEENRNYKVQITNLSSAPSRKEGVKLEASAYDEGQNVNTPKLNTLNAPAYGDGQQAVLYRIYVPDINRSESGGVPMPTPVLILKDGTELRGDDACLALKARQMANIKPNAIGIPMGVYRDLVNQPNKPETWPAQVPPKWFLQYDRKFLRGIYNGEMPSSARKSTGGFYPNLDNNYVRTIVNRKHGKLFVLRGKLPTTPKTYQGNEIRTAGQLVYWSICSNQGFANTRVNDCLYDEQIPVNKNGEYLIVVSRPEDRPRNARPECGVGWLPMAADGDGAMDEDVTIVQIRNMLASPDFDQAIQKVIDIGTEKEVMGPYLPQAFYMQPGAFEGIFPCFAELYN